MFKPLAFVLGPEFLVESPHPLLRANHICAFENISGTGRGIKCLDCRRQKTAADEARNAEVA
jgi:hypothetical protein